MSRIRIAIVGAGKIARDQHVPAIARSGELELVAIADPCAAIEGIPGYPNLDALLREGPGIDAVAICTTPQVRYSIARAALEAGLHVLLEKPPCATLGEAEALLALAASRRVALYAAWHSQQAAGVEPARAWLREHELGEVSVTWKENVRLWHPGQTWLWRGGGLGVFDSGINSLSILTQVLPSPLTLRDAELSFPANCDTPIAARLRMTDGRGAPILVDLDFRHTGAQTWCIDVRAGASHLQLSHGGAVLRVDGVTVVGSADAEPDLTPEYSRLYARFGQLVKERRIEADLGPIRLVADALLCGRRIPVDAFHD